MNRFNYRRGWKRDPFGNSCHGLLRKTATVKSDLKHKDGKKVVFEAWKRETDGAPKALSEKGPFVWTVRVIIDGNLTMSVRGTPRAALVGWLQGIVELYGLGDLVEDA